MTTLFDAFETGTLIDPPSATGGTMSLDTAYALQGDLTRQRLAKGGEIVGFKAGFTNQIIWPQYNISDPIHGPVLSTTLMPHADHTATLPVGALPQAKIEPEVVLRLRDLPRANMTDAEILACVDAIAPAFELVSCPYPDWRGTAAEMTAAGALHARLVLGAWQKTSPDWLTPLTGFSARLTCDGVEIGTGTAANLLGSGPLAVLRHLAQMTPAPAWRPGQLVSTGTVTPAFDVAPGQRWHVTWDGIDLHPLTLSLV